MHPEQAEILALRALAWLASLMTTTYKVFAICQVCRGPT